jgi:cytoskeleton protein RodZ
MTDVRAAGIGAMLTEAREARGITLEQAERDTRIARRYLIALEREDFAAFPAEVYARGFLRSYAGYLRLNADELLARFPRTSAASDGAAVKRGDRRPRKPQPARRKRASQPPPGAIGGARGTAVRLGVPVLAALAAAFLLGHLASSGPSPFSTAARLSGTGTATMPANQTAPPSAVATQRMPDLRGLDETVALNRLRELGITPVVIEIPSREGPAGTVIRQSPAPNEPVGDRVVAIVISRGG